MCVCINPNRPAYPRIPSYGPGPCDPGYARGLPHPLRRTVPLTPAAHRPQLHVTALAPHDLAEAPVPYVGRGRSPDPGPRPRLQNPHGPKLP
ncbi:hypothetical protein SAV14893_033200 [Streptomyces avermitilis]|uniref:Uncharacterized protein n=1 Tax=Streptomyces avermitilis TaxID=33903 RepID=A0A4D4LZI2_STRAX|nr:hypothetical protein SAVMC3_45120 [Streptomyces avermitilis]GDY63927.1 hypothetical protein SAV14893_033200 [Streptomyces avermitilis]GDY75925.1 hypothetical protein SAV31267_054100 [Streptomyces avermitilis]GDY84889.1 hypothetical protein SAVCW2_40880 [Streptomyces avermitilis]